MFIENLDELDQIVSEIKNLSIQLKSAFEKLNNFEVKINPEFIGEQETAQAFA